MQIQLVLLLPFPVWTPLVFSSCLAALAGVSHTVLNRGGENGHPGLVPDLGGKLQLLVNVMIAVGFFLDSLY